MTALCIVHFTGLAGRVAYTQGEVEDLPCSSAVVVADAQVGVVDVAGSGAVRIVTAAHLVKHLASGARRMAALAGWIVDLVAAAGSVTNGGSEDFASFALRPAVAEHRVINLTSVALRRPAAADRVDNGTEANADRMATVARWVPELTSRAGNMAAGTGEIVLLSRRASDVASDAVREHRFVSWARLVAAVVHPRLPRRCLASDGIEDQRRVRTRVALEFYGGEIRIVEIDDDFCRSPVLISRACWRRVAASRPRCDAVGIPNLACSTGVMAAIAE